LYDPSVEEKEAAWLLAQIFVEGGLEIHVASERRRITGAFDPKSGVRRLGPPRW
jgi:hypothetical protein